LKRVCLHKTRADLERANKEIERLRDQVEKLKQELSAERQPPKWAKENKPTDNEGTRITKKKGEQARQGHAPQSRKEIPEIDERVVIFPERCPEHGHELPFPSDSKWYSHIQIDLPEPQKISTTEYVVGSSYCTRCKKYHGADWGRVSGSLYGPRLHATVSYWKFQLGLTLGKMQGLLKSQYGLEISTGQISEILSRTAEKFSDSYEDLKTNISSEAHLYAVPELLSFPTRPLETHPNVESLRAHES